MHSQLSSVHNYHIYISHSSAGPCGGVGCRALLCGAVLFHAAFALCFLSNIQQYQVYDAKYQVPGTGMYVFVFSYSSFDFLHS